MPDYTIHRLSPTLVFIVGPASNWAMVRGEDTTWLLVDGGYPGDLPLVIESIEESGFSGLPVAVLITHAHVDHLGAALHFASQGVPIWCSSAEAPNTTGERLSQISEGTVLAKAASSPLWDVWANHAMAVGALSQDRIDPAHLVCFDPVAATRLPLPGRPLPIVGAGHTPGHSAFLIDDVLLTGDTIVTDHPTSSCGICGQLLDAAFHHDCDQTLEAARALLRVDAATIAPGHGPPRAMRQVISEFSAQPR